MKKNLPFLFTLFFAIALFFIGFFFLDLVLANQLFFFPKSFHPFLEWLSFCIAPILHFIVWPTLYCLSYFFFSHKKVLLFIKHLVLSLFVTTVIVHCSKWLLGRARPEFLPYKIYGWYFFSSNYGFDSFPSGHATVAFCLFSSFSHYFSKYWIYFFLGCFVCSSSRIMLNYHFVSDIAGGVFIGIVTSELIWKNVKK